MELKIKGVLSPKASGSITITENGNYDVVDVANAVVEVPQPTGSITINANGEHNVKEYANAVVEVKPSGIIDITENGEHDVANYEKANVNVVDEESAITLEALQILVDKWGTTSEEIFSGSDIKEVPKTIDFGNVKQTGYFSKCIQLEKVEDINTKNVKTLDSWFNACSKLKYLLNIDCSSASTMQFFAVGCSQLVEASFKNVDKLTTIKQCFNSCTSLEKVEGLDGILIDDMQQAFMNCYKIKELRFKKAKPSNISACFSTCKELKTLELDLINVTSSTSPFANTTNMENLTLYNIKLSMQIGSGYGYGDKISLESLIHTIQELIDTGSSKTLTIGSINRNKLTDVYVKVISEAPDENGNVKLPFEVCESTDEGAMLITNYVTLKNWALA